MLLLWKAVNYFSLSNVSEVDIRRYVILKYSLGSQRQESKIQNNLFKTFNLHPMLQV